MCNTYSESGACLGVQRCEEYEALKQERDALLKVREAADKLAAKVDGMFHFGSALNGTHAGLVRDAAKAYKEARDGM